MKKRILALLIGAEKELNNIVEEYKTIQGNNLLSSEGKAKKVSEINERGNSIRKKLLTDAEKIMDEEIRKVFRPERNVYGNSFNQETECQLRFIDMMKESLTKEEVENLLYNYSDNKVVRRALIPLADKYGIEADKSDYIFNADELEKIKKQLIGMLKVIQINEKNTIKGFNMALFFKDVLDQEDYLLNNI